MVTQLSNAVANSVTHTEATKEPVIRVSATVVDSAAPTTVVVAVLAGRGGGALGAIVRLGRAGCAAVGRHLDGTGRSVILIKVGVAWSAPRNVLRLGDARGLAEAGFGDLDGRGRLGPRTK